MRINRIPIYTGLIKNTAILPSTLSLFFYPESEEQFISDEPQIKATLTTKVHSSPPANLKTPPATPKGILDNIPSWQRDLVLDDKTVALKSGERKSEVGSILGTPVSQ